MTNKIDFDDYTENYNELLKENTSFFSSSEEYFAKYKIDLVCKKMQFLPKKILEYGCGIGRNISFLKSAYPDALIIGSDISNASLEIARKENADVDFFREYEGAKLDITFDLIFVAGVFHHVPVLERDKVAGTLFKRLSVGGQLFIFEHNPYNPITRRIVSSCPYDEDAVLLKPSELKSILSNAKLSVGGSEYCLFVPPSFSFLTQVEKFLGWFPMGGQYWVSATRLS